MRSPSLAVLALAVAVGVPATSRAGGSLFTPPAPANADSVACLVQNLGPDEEFVTARLHDLDGVVIASTTGAVGGGAVRAFADSDANVGLSYCEFEGLSKSLRGFLTSSGGDGVVLPTVR